MCVLSKFIVFFEFFFFCLFLFLFFPLIQPYSAFLKKEIIQTLRTKRQMRCVSLQEVCDDCVRCNFIRGRVRVLGVRSASAEREARHHYQ